MNQNVIEKILRQAARFILKENLPSDTCYYGNCCETPIDSHTIQRALLKETIGSSGDVYTLTPDVVAKNISQGRDEGLEKTSVNKAGVFKGFCGDRGKAHDSNLFKKIEDMDMLKQVSNKEYVFLYAYRSLIYQLCLETGLQSKTHSQSDRFLKGNEKISNQDINTFNRHMTQLEGVAAESDSNLNKYRKFQTVFEKYLDEDGNIEKEFTDEILIKVKEVTEPIEFVGVGAKLFSTDYPVVYGLLPPNGNKPAIFFIVAHCSDRFCLEMFNKCMTFNECHTIENLIALSGNLMMSENLYNKLKSNNELEKLYGFIAPSSGKQYDQYDIISSHGFVLFK